MAKERDDRRGKETQETSRLRKKQNELKKSEDQWEDMEENSEKMGDMEI